MVASANADPYAPFPRGPGIDEGFQSSEEGSDLHSPIFETPYPPEVRYHLGHLDLHSVPTNLLPPSFDARFSVPNTSVQLPESHILETLQTPIASPTALHLSSHLHSDFSLTHNHSILDLPGPSPRLQLPATSPHTEYSFNVPQSRLSEPALRPHSHLPPPSRLSLAAPSAEQRPVGQPASASEKDDASGSNPSSARPPRREASTVVIACRQCRARKIRCDSTRPVCNNCTRRNNECQYDAVPKRRGPDKRPGTRQRSCKKRSADADAAAPVAKKKRKTNGDHDGSMISFDAKIKENVTGGARRAMLMSRPPGDDATGVHLSQGVPLVLETAILPRNMSADAIYPKDDFSPTLRRCHPQMYDSDSSLNKSFARPVDVNVARHQQDEPEQKPTYLPLSPSTEYSRKTWWDHLLDTYSASRQQSMSDISTDINFLLSNSSYWLSFINVPLFFQDLNDPVQRTRMQPALIMSALALSTLMKSSEIELGTTGRERAMFLRDSAQSSLEASCNSHAIDYALAEAALILALFEMSCHPQHTVSRANAALQFLDRIVQALSLSYLDQDDPDTCVFPPETVPSVYTPSGYVRPKRCSCDSLSSPTGQLAPDHYSISFTYNPPWDSNWSVADIRKEECRRLCWSALTLVASHTAHSAAFHEEPMELFLADPANYTLLFPGEAYERTVGLPSGQSPKESVWALYCRSMLLWNCCSRPRNDSWTNDERAAFAIDAWNETREVQDALDIHECNSDTALIYICREFLYNTRMTITYELRRLQDLESVATPMFSRRHAEEWLYYQDQVAKRVKSSVLQLGEVAGHLLSRRPFQVMWFSSQVSICLALWNYDRTLIHALDLAKSFLIPLDALNVLWPCQAQRVRRDELRQKLVDACNTAGLHPPLPAELTLPPILHA